MLFWMFIGVLAPLIKPVTETTRWLGISVKSIVFLWFGLLIVYSVREETWRHPTTSFLEYMDSDDSKEFVDELLCVWIVFDTFVATCRAICFCLLRRANKDQRVFANPQQWALGLLPVILLLLTFPAAWLFFAQNPPGK